MTKMTRRQYMWALGAAGITSVAGCASGDDASTETTPTTSLSSTDTPSKSMTSTPPETTPSQPTLAGNLDGVPMHQYDSSNTGVADGETGPTAGVTEVWRANVGGEAQPAVVDGSVYIPGNGISALSTADGSEQWHLDTAGFILSTPAVVDGTVYVTMVNAGGPSTGLLLALNAQNGNERWRLKVNGDIFAAPTVVDGSVYVGTTKGDFYKLHATDGTKQWQVGFDDQIRAAAAVAGGTVYVSKFSGGIHALSTDDGSERWSVQTTGFLTPPTVVNGTVYVAGEDSKVRALSAETGSKQWTAGTGESVQGSLAVTDDTVVANSGSSTYAFRASDGTVTWSKSMAYDERTEQGYIYFGPVVADGVVYVGNNKGQLQTIRTNGERMWTFKTPGNSGNVGMPAVVDNAAFVSTGNRTYALSEP